MIESLTKQQIVNIMNDLNKNFDPNNIDHIKQLLYLVILNQNLPEEDNITDFLSNLLLRCENLDQIQQQDDPIEPWNRSERNFISEFFSPMLQYLYFD